MNYPLDTNLFDTLGGRITVFTLLSTISAPPIGDPGRAKPPAAEAGRWFKDTQGIEGEGIRLGMS